MGMRMLRWSMGVTLKDKVLNEVVRSTFGVAPIADKMREARLHWFGHSYLQSLEKATKALRQSQPAEEKRPTGGHHSLLESSRLSSERGSLSSMISQLRNRTQRESTIDESDACPIIKAKIPGKLLRLTASRAERIAAGGERIVFDFPYEAVKEDNRRSLHMGRKSIHEIRELRSSIDHSLIKPPKLQRQQPRRFSINSYKEDSDSEQHVETVEGKQSVTSKPNVSKAKSPFRPAIESGSDLESIDFEIRRNPQLRQIPRVHGVREAPAQVLLSRNPSRLPVVPVPPRDRNPPSSTIKGELSDHSTDSSTRQPSPSSTRQLEEGKILDDSSRNSRAGMKRQQKTEDSYCSSGETSPSAGKDKARAQESSTNPRRRSKSRSRSASLTPPKPEIPDSTTNLLHQKSVEQQKTSTVHEKEFASRKSTSSSVSAAGTTHGGAVERPPSALPRAATYATLTEHSTQTEARKEPDSLPEYCSSNLHYVTRDVLQTHLQLLKEFNRLEFSSLQEWNAILDDVRQKYEGPSTKKLEAVLEKRMSKLSMEQV
ncbi:hypothetical protein ANCCEY_11379 [Ancylostoma ceylanicum]|uniref:Uncharacterized protein n=1 Tax=Ancylostoma ceylanicum TaxID=53326 RepID=A0A0D6LPG6_9BILA|nr:hypothetical protein ANCCEY_11379 [Ancylostoma ceylanicum]